MMNDYQKIIFLYQYCFSLADSYEAKYRESVDCLSSYRNVSSEAFYKACIAKVEFDLVRDITKNIMEVLK